MTGRWSPCPAECGRKRRPGDIMCNKCYLKLPVKLQRSLWETDWRVLNGNIALALNWLDEHREDKS